MLLTEQLKNFGVDIKDHYEFRKRCNVTIGPPDDMYEQYHVDGILVLDVRTVFKGGKIKTQYRTHSKATAVQ